MLVADKQAIVLYLLSILSIYHQCCCGFVIRVNLFQIYNLIAFKAIE